LFIFSGVGSPLLVWQLLLGTAMRARPNWRPLWLSRNGAEANDLSRSAV
jgi:hypothetical protein